MHQVQQVGGSVRQPRQQDLEPVAEPVAQEKCQEEHKGHDAQENRQAKPTVGQDAIHPIGHLLLLLVPEKDFMDHFFDKGVFFVDDLRLIAAI